MHDEKLDKMAETMRKSQAETIKAIVKETFEALELLEQQRNVMQDKIRVLKHCLADMKEGRLDRILERQQVDNTAKSVSGISIALTQSGSSAPKSPWYTEYDISMTVNGTELKGRVNNSVTRLHASGTYRLNNGQVKYL